MVKMARRKSPSKSTGLGMGLDALIKSKTREEPRDETVDAESVKDEKDIEKNSEVIDELDKSNSKAEPAKNSVQKKKFNSEKSSKSSVSSPKSVKKTSESKVDLSAKKTAKINESSNKSVVSADVERINVVVGDVKKNPRITLWSSRSAAVLRYLKKTQPEFSISKEASKLIEDAVKEKYPEIWELFDDL